MTGLTGVACGSTIIVTSLGTAALAAGGRFALFSGGTITGNFGNVILPALAAGLVWNTNNLNVNSTISVIAANPTNLRFNVSGNLLSLS